MPVFLTILTQCLKTVDISFSWILYCKLQARMLFVETHYTLATEEAERIGVDHVARLSNTGTIDGSTGIHN